MEERDGLNPIHKSESLGLESHGKANPNSKAKEIYNKDVSKVKAAIGNRERNLSSRLYIHIFIPSRYYI